MPQKSEVTIYESPYAPRELPAHAAPGQVQLQHDGSFAIQGVLRVLSRRRKWLVGAIIVSLVVATAVTLFVKPVYEATVTIELNKSNAGSLDFGIGDAAQAQAGGAEDLGTDLQTETAILEGDSLALVVIHKLNLGAQPPFLPKWPAFLESTPTAEESPEARARMLDIFRQDLKVMPVRGTRLSSRVTYEGHDPSQDAHIANALIEAYKRQYLQSHYDASSEASDWLTHQLSELKTNVESSEKTLTDFEKDSGILNLPSAAGDPPAGSDIHSVVLEKLDTLNSELTEAEANAIEKESIYRLALTGNYDAISALGASASRASASPAPGRTTSTAQSANATTLQQLQAKQNDLKVELARQTEIYGTNNRHLRELETTGQRGGTTERFAKKRCSELSERVAGDFQIAGELKTRSGSDSTNSRWKQAN